MVSIINTSKRKKVKFAQGTFNLPKGKGTTTMKLTRAGSKYLRTHKSAKSMLTVLVADATKQVLGKQKTVRISRRR
jgi:hypothetical protein